MKQLAGPEKLILTFETEQLLHQATSQLVGFDLSPINDVSLSVKLPDTVQTVMDILSILQNAALNPVSFEVTAPTLDDVFMQLTKEV